MIAVSAIYHSRLELKALSVKIEKLERWMYMYRAGKIRIENTRYVIEVMIMLAEAEREQTKLLNNK